MQIIKQGAEAILYLDRIDGQELLIKERIKKRYRLEQIDEKIRKTRTKQEVKLLTESSASRVQTPKILFSDSYKIGMEYIQGQRIKELFKKADQKTIKKLSSQIGKLIGKLHSSDIIHGDLTTSNMILKDNKIYFIDFGLGKFSKRIEDQGIDLNLLYEALKSTHFKILKVCWSNILKSYGQEYKDSDKVLKKVDEIEKRARYAKK